MILLGNIDNYRKSEQHGEFTAAEAANMCFLRCVYIYIYVCIYIYYILYIYYIYYIYIHIMLDVSTDFTLNRRENLAKSPLKVSN